MPNIGRPLSAEGALRARVAALKGSVLDLRGRSIQYNILQREVDTNRGLYDALLQRYKEIGVAGGIGTSPVSIVDRAEVPGGPYKPNLLLNLLAGLGLGAARPASPPRSRSSFSTIRSRPARTSATSSALACLGVVPKRRGKGSVVEELKDPRRRCRRPIRRCSPPCGSAPSMGAPKTLLVTSTRRGEGKSSTALALAQNFRGAASPCC